MKQTNNALKYLLAQYRAIFKNAYFKGIASAVLLTAGLAAGQAQATDYTTVDQLINATDDPLEIDGSKATDTDTFIVKVTADDSGKTLNRDLEFTLGSGSAFRVYASGAAGTSGTNTIDGGMHDITINAANGATKEFIFGHSGDKGAKLQIKNIGTLTIDGVGTGRNTSKVVVDAGTSSGAAGVDIWADVVNITDSIVEINNNTAASSAKAQANNAILRGLTMNISGEDTVVSVGNASLSGASTANATGNVSALTKAVLGWRPELNDNGSVKYSGSNITVSDGAKVVLQSAKMNNSSALGYGADIWGRTLNFDNAELEVTGWGGQIRMHESTFDNSYVNIKDGASLTLMPRLWDDPNNGGTNFDGKLTLNGGTLVIDGTLSHGHGGTLTISDSTALTASSTYNSTNDDATTKFKRDNALVVGLTELALTASSKVISGASYDSSTLPTLELSSGKLNEFLNSTNETVYAADGKTEIADNLGTLALSYGARVNLTDTAQVEMSKFKFSSDSGAGAISLVGADTYKTAQKVGATDDDQGQLDGDIYITAADMSIGKSLLNDQTKTGADSYKVSSNSGSNSSMAMVFAANKLTLGSEKGQLAADDNGFDSSKVRLGVLRAEAYDELYLIDAVSNTFTLQDDVTLKRDYYTKDASGNYTTTLNSVGTIAGDSLTIGGNTTVSSVATSGSLTVAGGAWENNGNQTLTIASGSLSVTADAAEATALQGSDNYGTWNYHQNGNPSSLTWHGNFIISGSSATNANVKVTGASGADATLDLTDANVTWGSGAVTISGNSEDGEHTSAADYFARAGQGILKITGNELSDFLDLTGDDTTTQTTLDLQKGGVLLVDGAVTGAIGFDKFTNKSSGLDAGKLNFNSGSSTSGGWLVSTGELSLENNTDTETALVLGDGAIIAQGISVTDKATNKSGVDPVDNIVTVSGGALFVAERFTSANNEVVFHNSELSLGAHDMAVYGIDNASNVGTVAVNKLTFSGSSQLNAYTGDWTIANNGTLSDIYFTDSATLNVGDDAVYRRLGQTASLTADNVSFDLASNDTTNDIFIDDGSKATFYTIQADNADIYVDGGTLTLLGRTDIDVDLETEPDSLTALGRDANTQAGISLEKADITVDGGNFILGDTAANALVKLSLTTSGDTTTSNVDINATLTSANINLTNGAVLKLDYSSGSAATINGGKGLTADQARLLKQNLVDSLERGSYINVGQVALDMPYDPTTMTTQWDQVKDFVQVSSDVTNDVMPQVLLQGVSAGDQISGHFAAVQGDTVGMTTISVDGDLWLHKAWQNADGNKYFAFTDSKKPIGLSLGSYSSLSLYGEGIVGTLAGNGTAGDSLVLFKEGEFQPGITTVSGSITGIGEIIVDNDVVVTNDVKVGAVDISKSLQAPTVTIDGQNGASLITGTLSATQSLNIGEGTHDAAVYVADGTVNTTNLTLTDGSLLQVGWDAADTDDTATTNFNEAANYSGRLEVTGALNLNGGELYVDPAYNQPTALASINNLSGTQQTDLFADTLDGSVFVGRNSALGIGSDSLATLEEKIARFQHNGSLVENEVGAVVYLGKAFTLGSGQSLVLTNQTLEGFTNYYNTAASTNYAQSAILGSLNDTVYLGDNTAILVSAPVASRAEAGSNTTPLISFAGATGKVIADGGDIVIDGDVRAATYQVFESGSSITYVNNTAYAPVEDADAPAYEDNINVTTENDFLQGVVGADGTVTLGVNPQGRAIMRGASDPVYASLVAYARGYNGAVPTAEEEAAHQVAADSGYTQIAGVSDNRLLYSYDAQGNRVYGQYSNYFLQETISTGDGSAAEAVARLAVFGGAAQAAITAGASSYEAISGRMGMGATGYNLTVADNTQGAALWVTPMYKSSESDGFAAEGVDYGVDLNLYGVALGADYTLANGVSFGAMFNVGSGDVDGKDAGSAVSNDFDYYGFGVYGGYSLNNFKVVADLTYTVADNDLEANTSIDKVGASLDTSNLSLGVTAHYAFDFTGASVTPHAGLRYSYIDMDDYEVDGAGAVASYDGDSMGIFSIPVGVTVAKEFVGDNWSVKPSFDLTLTGNFGDDETDGTVHWAGVENLSTNVSSEVIDNFTYGATLGVAAKTGNFSLGLGVNYTGSSSTDEYGVKANARFVF